MSFTQNKISPPKFAVWLLSRFLFGIELSEKLGDLEEEFYYKLNNKNLLNAKLWYWKQTLLTIPVCIKNILAWGGIMFQNYIKIALRNIKKHKAFSAINILGLAMGMACCFLILLWVQDELSFDKFHKNADNLYRIVVTDGEDYGSSSPWALVSTLKKDYPEFLKGTRFIQRTYNIRCDDKKFYEKAGLVDQEFFEMFSFPLIKGNSETVLSNVNSIVMTEETSIKFFGDENPIGKTVTLENGIDLTVTGILENIPNNSHIQFDVLVRPAAIFSEEKINGWSYEGPSYVLLTAGSNYKKVTEKISDTIIKYDKRYKTNIMVELQPFTEVYLYSLGGTDPIVYVYIFSGIALIVLLIACINFMNLTTAKSSQRAKEIGMRKVIGAQKSDIIKQFFGESIVMAVVALIIAVTGVYLFLPIFNEVAGKEISINFLTDKSLLGGLLGITILTGIISGTYPALYLSSFRAVQVLKNMVIKGGKKQTFRRILIVFQFSAAIVLIICTSLILKQMEYIRSKDLGFERENILRVTLDETLANKFETIKNELLNDKNISKVTASNNVPLNVNSFNPFWWEGKEREDYESMMFVLVDPDYFDTFGMNIKYGRKFIENSKTDSSNYIINETALGLTGFTDPIGKKFAMWKNEGELIGVVENFNSSSLHEEIAPIAFMISKNSYKRTMFAKVDSKNIPEAIDKIEKTLTGFSPSFIFEYHFLDEDFDNQYKSETQLLSLLKYFTFLAIFISCLGLLGLASFMAEQKRKEIAIRKVLGASVYSVVSNLSKEFVTLIAFSNLIAWPVAYYFMKNWIESFSFHTEIGYEIFVLAGAAAIIVALLTTGFQAFKAANSNPVNNLKCE